MKVFLVGGPTVSRESDQFEVECANIAEYGRELGKAFAKRGHELIVCSPFEDSLDYHVILGAAKFCEENDSELTVEFHYPNTKVVDKRFKQFAASLGKLTIVPRPCSPVQSEEETQGQYSWLFAQLNALDSCAGAVALGGKTTGAASLLFELAKARNKSILPITAFGGAAANHSDTEHWDLLDILKDGINSLSEFGKAHEIPALLEKLVTGLPSRKEDRYFISYARARPQEADFIETLLRRRNGIVYRDEKDFDPGEDTQADIIKNIKKSNVFIAVWCQEYACSPWCFDELELALKRRKGKLMDLWIFCVDETRMVPKAARSLNYIPIKSREEIEGEIEKLIRRRIESSGDVEN